MNEFVVSGVIHPTGLDSEESTQLILTQKELEDIAPKLVGKPVYEEHAKKNNYEYDDRLIVGRVDKAYVHPETKELWGDIVIDGTTTYGPDVICDIRNNKRLGLSMGWTSDVQKYASGKQRVTGRTPLEVSVVKMPALAGAWIKEIHPRRVSDSPKQQFIYQFSKFASVRPEKKIEIKNDAYKQASFEKESNTVLQRCSHSLMTDTTATPPAATTTAPATPTPTPPAATPPHADKLNTETAPPSEPQKREGSDPEALRAATPTEAQLKTAYLKAISTDEKFLEENFKLFAENSQRKQRKEEKAIEKRVEELQKLNETGFSSGSISKEDADKFDTLLRQLSEKYKRLYLRKDAGEMHKEVEDAVTHMETIMTTASTWGVNAFQQRHILYNQNQQLEKEKSEMSAALKHKEEELERYRSLTLHAAQPPAAQQRSFNTNLGWNAAPLMKFLDKSQLQPPPSSAPPSNSQSSLSFGTSTSHSATYVPSGYQNPQLMQHMVNDPFIGELAQRIKTTTFQAWSIPEEEPKKKA